MYVRTYQVPEGLQLQEQNNFGLWVLKKIKIRRPKIKIQNGVFSLNVVVK
jgi:hypothetical protein